MTRERKALTMTGFALAIATIATRLPIRSRTLFEFDSINFAVGAFRFDLGQVTPQVPGYIVHVLFGRLMNLFTHDINLAYIWVSLLLSVGSVLFLWRAGAQLRGERVGTVTALLWLTTPLFWFHGAVNAIYAEEAFYTSALMYLGIRWLKRETPQWEPILFAIALSMATGARQTSILFFLPATIFLIVKRAPSKQILAWACGAFAIVSFAWLFELLRESGGLSAYIAWAKAEQNFKTQSVLFGHTWQSEFDTIGKVLFDFAAALGPMGILVFIVDIIFTRKLWKFINAAGRNTKGQFVVLVAIVPFGFYLIVFFMKAGYLLNVLPSATLACGVLLDEAAIWIAEKQKRRAKDKTILSRPLITKNASLLTGAIAVLNVLWFFVPWPGTEQAMYDNEDTRNSFIHGAVHRYEHSESRWLTLANRAFEYTNVSGIRAVDRLNETTLAALQANHGNDSCAIILASWWYRWAYALLPHATVYDIELDPNRAGALWVGKAHEMNRVQVADSTIEFHSQRPVLLLLRHDRPDFDEISRQVHLRRLPLPDYLDIYLIEDSTFQLRWGNRVFIEKR